MQDLGLAGLVDGALLVILVFVSSGLAAQHTDVQLPKFLAGTQVQRGRRSLLVTIPWVTAIIGGGELVAVLFLFHPLSTFPVRLVSAAELAAGAAWLWYLGTLIRRPHAKP